MITEEEKRFLLSISNGAKANIDRLINHLQNNRTADAKTEYLNIEHKMKEMQKLLFQKPL